MECGQETDFIWGRMRHGTTGTTKLWLQVADTQLNSVIRIFRSSIKKKMKVLLDCQLPMDDIFAVIVITQPPPSRGCFILVICLSLAYTTVWSSELDTLLMRHEVNLTPYRTKSVSNSLDQTVYSKRNDFDFCCILQPEQFGQQCFVSD